ncbi:hypothetical protein [Streptomyces spiralis]
MTVDESVARLRALLADPQAGAHGKPATAGEAAEQRHLLYDADADASTPAFPYPTTSQEAK